MDNTFCHVELMTGDVEKAKDFYGKLFSWKLEETPMEGGAPYIMINTGKEPGGGMMKAPEGAPTAWSVYVLVESVADYVKKAEGLGGKVLVPETEVPKYGKFAFILDPTGGAIGLWESFEK